MPRNSDGGVTFGSIGLDALALFAAIGTWEHIVPVVVGMLAVIWYSIEIYECRTLTAWRHRRQARREAHTKVLDAADSAAKIVLDTAADAAAQKVTDIAAITAVALAPPVAADTVADPAEAQPAPPPAQKAPAVLP